MLRDTVQIVYSPREKNVFPHLLFISIRPQSWKHTQSSKKSSLHCLVTAVLCQRPNGLCQKRPLYVCLDERSVNLWVIYKLLKKGVKASVRSFTTRESMIQPCDQSVLSTSGSPKCESFSLGYPPLKGDVTPQEQRHLYSRTKSRFPVKSLKATHIYVFASEKQKPIWPYNGLEVILQHNDYATLVPPCSLTCSVAI